jgi:hypothetical protein
LGAVLLLVLIVGGAGGFYAYRRRQAQPAAAPVKENPAQVPVSDQSPKIDSFQVDPAKTTETKIEKKVESSQRAGTSKQPIEKAESSKPAKEEPSPPNTVHDPARDANRDRDLNQAPPKFPSPEDPRFDPFRNRRGPGHPPSGVPNVRTLPNGTRIVTQPDGTRIITGPKGAVQVIPPGSRPVRPLRKRDRP